MKNLRQQNDFRFEKVGNKRLPDEGSLPISVYPIAVWKSAKFLVQAYAEKNDIIRLSVNIIKDREHIKGVHFKWKDGITWDELQAIKNAVGYLDRDAVEVYPAQTDVVNVSNMRHLWILPEKLDFAWRRKSA